MQGSAGFFGIKKAEPGENIGMYIFITKNCVTVILSKKIGQNRPSGKLHKTCREMWIMSI